MYKNVKKQLINEAHNLTPDVSSVIFDEYNSKNTGCDCALSGVFRPILRRCTAVILSLVLVAVSVLGFLRFTALSPEPSEKKTPGISLIIVSAAENDEERYEVSVCGNVTMELPIRGLLIINELKENSESEIAALSHEAHKKMKEYLKMDEDENTSKFVQIHPAQNVLVAFGCLNDFLLDGIDAQALSDIHISLEGSGILRIENLSQAFFDGRFQETIGKEFVISAEEFKAKYSPKSNSGKGMHIQWTLDGEFVSTFADNPKPAASSVKETVTFTVNYKNGSSESFQVIISFDENGEMRAIYKK